MYVCWFAGTWAYEVVSVGGSSVGLTKHGGLLNDGCNAGNLWLMTYVMSDDRCMADTRRDATVWLR